MGVLPSTVARIANESRARAEALIERHQDPSSIPLMDASEAPRTLVEGFWETHTVNSQPFHSARESLRYLARRSEEYPLFERLMELEADHSDDVVLDYGCGPGNDVVGFAVRGHARRVIGADVSMHALQLARHRLALHGLDAARVELVRVSDNETRIPLESGSIDYLYCEGVIHHTSHPEQILSELSRVLRSGGLGHVMVYNRDSLWFHLYTAYCRQVVEGAFPGLTADEAFQRNTDGEECPIARAYRPEDFAAMCRDVGFRVSFAGGYFARLELELMRKSLASALSDSRLDAEHKRFLRDLRIDADGYPRHAGMYAGIGGVFRVAKD